MKTFADKVIEYNKTLEYQDNLPEGIRIMNPFKEGEMSFLFQALLIGSIIPTISKGILYGG